MTLSLEPGIARILPVLDSSEKSLKSQIDADGHILKRLGIGRIEGSPLSFQGRERSYLVVQGQSSSIPFPGVLSMLKKMIVEPSTLFQLLVQKGFLLPGRIQPILECFSHVVYMYIMLHKKSTTRLISPCLKQRAYGAFEIKDPAFLLCQEK